MRQKIDILLLIIMVLLIAVLPLLPFTRIDLTAEKRFSIAPQSQHIVENLPDQADIVFYSGGNIDANFARLNRAAAEMVEELNVYAKPKITYRFVNPSEADNDDARERNYYNLEQRGLRGMSVASRDADGHVTQSIAFPWAEVAMHGDTMPVCLLQPNGQRSGEDGINSAIENLEFELIDALHTLSKKSVDKIAFIEGHGELPEEEVYAASESFSRYFQIDRGTLGTDADVLNDYKAIIIAKPTQPFSEADKYIIDQYIMRGGRVVWLIDGTQMQENALTQTSATTLIPLDVNLSDQLFRYGVRINNNVVQDAQCTYMPINVARPGDQPQFEPVPWCYAPLLLVSPHSPITKNIMQVKADFASTIDFTNNNDRHVQKEILLITSNATHVSQTPHMVDLNQLMNNAQNNSYWHTRYQPIGALLQGTFTSAFTSQSRPAPQGITSAQAHADSSVPTRMIVVADGDLIRNDLEQSAQGWRILPLGYDRTTHTTFGNRDFLLNALLYLTDDEGLMALRNRQIPLRLLNKTAVTTNRRFWQCTNILLPLCVLAVFGGAFFALRKRKYRTKLTQ